jgi:hypothetical protein
MADSGQGYIRPREGFRFQLGGLKTNATPDALPSGKYPYIQNVRAANDNFFAARAGMVLLYDTFIHGATEGVTDIRAYTALNTDNLPRLLWRSNVDNVWLGGLVPPNATVVGTLEGDGASPGASMIPFRPAESPNPWMYIANGRDYQKFSAPAPITDAVTQQKVGIAEPQLPCDAVILTNSYNVIPASYFAANAGVASVVTDQVRITDNIVDVFQDPAGTPYATSSPAVTLGVGAPESSPDYHNYTRQMGIIDSTKSEEFLVQDVFPILATAQSIAGIYYYAGATGRCVVVPKFMGSGPGDEGTSILTQNFLSSIRRGSLVKFSGGPETCLVWSVTQGPDGSVCFETSTALTHTDAETFTIPPAIQVCADATSFTNGDALTAPTVGFNLSGAGIGTITTNVGIGTPFTLAGQSMQPEDYVHASFAIQFLASLNEVKVLFDVGDGTFTSDFYFYAIRVSDIQAAVDNTLTQLGAAQLVVQRATIDEEDAAAARNQGTTASGDQTTPGDGAWVEIVFPVSALTRVGNDQTRSLQNVNSAQFLFNVNAATDASIGDMSMFGINQPDVGTNGAPYLYRCRPRSSVTGIKGNPSPAVRYGCNPRRNPVLVVLPPLNYDAQIDTVDIFRYGGTVTSWRWIGQTSVTSPTFLDNYSDLTAQEGEELEFDNLEPWPSIDLPFALTSLTNEVNAIGTTVLIPQAYVTVPNNILSWLPGNLIRLGSVNVYTLWTRPTLITVAGVNYYLLQFVENAGVLTGAVLYNYEPELANQFLPYMFGPDAAGTVFATGDRLRPGTLSFAKNYAPDNAPDSYNIEITPPSEPLLGGEILDGLAFVASTERWWALYPQASNPLQRYSVIQQPMTRGLAAPYGHCNDGQTIYWWAKDGIWSSAKGSLTDADLYNLFPHEGIPGANYTYNGQTVYAPNYAAAGQFRLAYCNHYLFATYVDATGAYRALVYDIRRGAWVVDTYAAAMSVYYALEQQEGTLLSSTAAYPLLVAGGAAGNVYQPTPLANDTGPSAPVAVPVVVATNEWDAGDLRAGYQWGDLWIDCIPNALATTPNGGSPVQVTPMALGLPAAAPTTIATSASRSQQPVSVGGELLSDFLGMMVTWADDYTAQTAATTLVSWQPSFIPKPENIADRWTDWYDGGTEAAKYVQGFLLHCDTFNVVKGMSVYDSDTLTGHPFTPAVQHNGESVKAYSFNTPFIAHLVQLRPTLQPATPLAPYTIAATQQIAGLLLPTVFIVTLDAPFSAEDLATLTTALGYATATFSGMVAGAANNGKTYTILSVANSGTGAYAGFGQFRFSAGAGPAYPMTADTGTVSVNVAPATGGNVLWRFFGVEFIYEATPEFAETWQTQGTSFGMNGYSHIQRLTGAYAATAPVTITFEVDDGTAPEPIVLPSTGGAYQKLLQVLTANKGQLFFFRATSIAPFQFWLDDFELVVGNWGRQGPYVNYKSLGGKRGDQATI